MKTDAALILKKQTLTAWTNLLYKQGKINLAKRTKMITAIEKLKS